MIVILAAIYRANPFRPHCGGGRHVRLCRWIVPRSRVLTCPGHDLNPNRPGDFPF